MRTHTAHLSRTVAVALIALLCASCGITTPSTTDGDPTVAPPASVAGPGATMSLIDAVGLLEVAREQPRSGYDRDLFDHWVDADDNGCDTRCEVLTRDFDPNVIDGGGWRSPYDGLVASSPDELQIDHVVALAEAWDSGADTWDADRRREFANDLDERRALVAASAASNQEKSDRDPRQWLPVAEDHCRYVDAWVAVKYRWGLTADAAEVDVLSDIALACTDHLWTAPAPAGAPATAPTAPSTTVAPDTATAFMNCDEARAAGAAPVHAGSPGYSTRLDGDGDGVACE